MTDHSPLSLRPEEDVEEDDIKAEEDELEESEESEDQREDQSDDRSETSSSSSDGDEDEDDSEDEEEPKAEAVPDENGGLTKLSTPDVDQEAEPISPVAMQEGLHPGRKRRRSASPADTRRDVCRPPLKRAQRQANVRYSGLLAEYRQDVEEGRSTDGGPEMPRSQIGLTVWEKAEKERFFDALARLGRDDLVGIAQRVGTKGELEVRQYLWLLGEEHATAAKAGFGQGRSPRLVRKLQPTEMPAALEVGEACCRALEEAADGLALQEETREEDEAVQQHGDQWLVTPENCQALTMAAEAESEVPGLPSPLVLFNTASMLKLSARLFMNGVTRSGNWRTVGKMPALRLEALQDLQALVSAAAQRLTAAALYFCAARLRARIGGGNEGGSLPRLQQLVQRRDVAAAVASLGLQHDSNVFWARCARRLDLRVYRSKKTMPRAKPRKRKSKKRRRKVVVTRDDEEDYKEVTEGPVRPMTFDEVEKELLPVGMETEWQPWPVWGEEDEEEDEEEEADEDEDEDEDENRIEDEEASEDETVSAHLDARVDVELDEAIRFSVLGCTRSRWSTSLRRGLRARIAADLRAEDYADAVDAHEGGLEEQRLWAFLEREPPSLSDGEEAGPPPPTTADLEAMAATLPEGRRYPLEEVFADRSGCAGGWREKLAYQSEWEATAESAEAVLQVTGRRCTD
ncbi:DNA-binding protein [Grosmannia clavigera kw1407]|uniref:DNA-binding protein n=1 Tax=Grosmannia clavigera (strain kw1407 / UAMH 11150) TaxID=655863 RepID=F0XI47_GROCL|nr:DNA-binding protein [Grosmannia clavigera kw1407]EFX03007.1 DNA-binding protein [Grosmannia clavigera kw1407]